MLVSMDTVLKAMISRVREKTEEENDYFKGYLAALEKIQLIVEYDTLEDEARMAKEEMKPND